MPDPRRKNAASCDWNSATHLGVAGAQRRAGDIGRELGGELWFHPEELLRAGERDERVGECAVDARLELGRGVVECVAVDLGTVLEFAEVPQPGDEVARVAGDQRCPG